MANREAEQSKAGCGCGLGSIIAIMLSIKTWGLTWWALLHFLLGWVYVFYWIIFRSGWLG